MATPPPSSVALTESARVAQVRRAEAVAAAVAAYYRSKVNVEDPSSIDAWLALVIPRILAERRQAGRQGALFGDLLRRLEAPNVRDDFRYDPSRAELDASVVISSLFATAISPVRSKMTKIGDLDAPPETKQQLIAQANTDAVTMLTGAVERHVQNGARQVLFEGQKEDKVALGYVRVTKADPCYFCQMLASRGLVYGDDSFDESDARFTGSGTVKVHDNCHCALKPAYTRNDPFLEQSKKFEALWREAGNAGGGRSQINAFRKLVEGR